LTDISLLLAGCLDFLSELAEVKLAYEIL